MNRLINEVTGVTKVMTNVELLERGFFSMSLRQIAAYLDISSRLAQEFVNHSDVSSCKVGLNCLSEEVCRHAGIPLGSGSKNFNLYRNDEVLARLKACTTSRVETVRVPMSCFAEDAAAFRRQFILDRIADFNKRDTENKRLRIWVSKDLPSWNCVKYLTVDGAEQLFLFKKDVLDYAYERGEKTPAVLDSKLPGVQVQLPDIFPFFESLNSFGQRSAMAGPGTSARTVLRWTRRLGAAIHDISFDGDYPTSTPHSVVRYTDGLLLGRQDNWPDYLIGATVAMTAVRAKALFGDELGKRWMFTSKNVRTASDLPYSDWTIGATAQLKREVPEWYQVETDLRKLNYHV